MNQGLEEVDKNKTNKALKEVQQILADNACEHEVFIEEKEASGYKGYDLVLVIGGDGSMLSAAKLFSHLNCCLLYTSPSPRDRQKSRKPSSA